MQPLFRQISEIAADSRLARMIGVIAYSDAHPYYKQVFADVDLTLALNELSKKRWILFASVPPARGLIPAAVAAATEEAKDAIVKAVTKVAGLPDQIFVPDSEQSTFMGSSKPDADVIRVRNDLGLDENDRLPCLVLIFPVTVNLESGLFDGFVQKYTLDAGTSKDTAFAELRKWAEEVTVAIEDVNEANLTDAEGVAAAVKFRLTSTQDLERLKRHLPLLPKVAAALKKILGVS